jgi:hypothetical protein
MWLPLGFLGIESAKNSKSYMPSVKSSGWFSRHLLLLNVRGVVD